MQSMLKIGNQQILVNHPDGTTLTMEGGTLRASAPSHCSVEAQLTEEMGKQGIQWRDAIAWATSKAGISPCPPCKARQRILNNAKNLGVMETIRQIKDTFRGSK